MTKKGTGWQASGDDKKGTDGKLQERTGKWSGGGRGQAFKTDKQQKKVIWLLSQHLKPKIS